MKLVVGLGNPGAKYEGTRHNVGFEIWLILANRHGTSSPKTNFQGEVVEARLASEKVLLLGPQTYMNRSGQSVRQAVDFYKIPLEDVLIICDDLNLPTGKLRIRARGSSGGQRGLDDIIRHLGGQEFARLRLGIGRPPENWDAADYVLGRFTTEEQDAIRKAYLEAADAVATWVREGTQTCMNQFN